MNTKKNPDVELQSLALRAINQLSDFFTAKEHGGKDIAVARVSTAVLGAWTRAQQTRSAEKATMFMVARELATDKEQLKKYIALTMPESGILTVIPQAIEVATENRELKRDNQILEGQRDKALLSSVVENDALVTPGD